MAPELSQDAGRAEAGAAEQGEEKNLETAAVFVRITVFWPSYMQLEGIALQDRREKTMKTRLSRMVIRLTAASILSGSMIGIAGPAQGSEHVLLARQTGVPAAELGVSNPVGPHEAKDCYWFKGKLYCITYG